MTYALRVLKSPLRCVGLFLLLIAVLFTNDLQPILLINRAGIEYSRMKLRQDQSVIEGAQSLATMNDYLSVLPKVGAADRLMSVARAFDLAQRQVSMPRLEAQSAYREGLVLQANGEWESASHSFKTALQIDPSFMPALLSLAGVLGKLERRTDLAYLTERIEKAEPDYAFTVSILPGLEFLGFDVDENSYAFASRVPLVIYWRTVDSKKSASLQITEDAQFRTYAWGDRVFQVGDVKNLVSNAGFEDIPFMATNFPISFGRAYTPESVWSPYGLKVITRRNMQSTVLCLTNNAKYYRTGVTTLPLTVEPGRKYLAAIWMKNDSTSGGYPLIYETSTTAHDNLVLHPLLERFEDDGWHFRADVVSITQPFVRFWMANFDAVGEVCYDNLLLIPLSYPPLGTAMSGNP